MNSKNTKATSNNSIETIGFHIGNEEYALPIKKVKEVLITPNITRVPLAPDHIMGVVNLRGNIIPVFDIAKRLKIGATKLGEESRTIAVELDNETIAIAAESVSKVTRVDAKKIKAPPRSVSGISTEYLDGVARLTNRFLIFLNIQNVLSTETIITEEQ